MAKRRMQVKIFRNNQKGIIQLGIIAVFVLAAGLFAASRLASNPDLTFFNIAEKAKGIEQDLCLDKKSNSARCFGKKKNRELEGLSDCDKAADCKSLKFQGASACKRNNSILYCCENNFKDLGNGKCERKGTCNAFACSEGVLIGSSVCYNAKHSGGWNCCPSGKHLIGLRNNVKGCTSLAGNPGECDPTKQCSGDPASGGSLCVKLSNLDQPLYCK